MTTIKRPAKGKHPGGRPTVMTDAVVKKLEEAFALGCTDLEACYYADITKQTLYNYCESKPGFLDRKETLKQRPIYLARKVIIKALLDDDRGIADKLLTRRDGSKTILSGDPDSPVMTVTRIELVPLASK
jgi:hypothetical protein